MLNKPEIPLLQDSAPLLDDRAALDVRWERDGYLFFRGVLDLSAIARVRDRYIDVLTERGLIEGGSDGPIWSGTEQTTSQSLDGIGEEFWRGLVAEPSFDRLARKVLGEAPVWLPIVVQRAATPSEVAEEGDLFAGRHQDGFFNAGIPFRICWIPLMEIDAQIGGLAVAAGSHKRSFHDEAKPPMFPIPEGAVPQSAWRRADYRPGDVLMFHNMLVHSALPNTSDKIRLSLDVRLMPESEPKPIIGTVGRIDESRLMIRSEDDGEDHVLEVNAQTYVRGRLGARKPNEVLSSLLPPGSRVIATTDGEGRARVVRPTS